MKEYSRYWKSSKNPRKQRKYRHSAPLHIKGKFLSVHLSKELRKRIGKRAIRIRKDDKTIIMRGNQRKTKSSVERVDVKNNKIYLTKIDKKKKDGTTTLIPIEPSNLMITELHEGDKRRIK